MQNIVTTQPFELIAINFVHPKCNVGGYENILILMDHFTSYAQAYATKNKAVRTVAVKIYNDLILLDILYAFTMTKEESLRTGC